MNSAPHLLIDGQKRSERTIILAHGAGAGMDTDFLDDFARGLGKRGLRVVRFEFPYMAARRETGKSRPPDREPVLRETWHRVIDSVKSMNLFIGGKSMGGRIASLVADEAEVAGLVCLGYPFHPTGKPDQLRTEHLKSIQTPTLIVQGERDPFGSRHEVTSYKLSRKVHVHWLTDGDHSFKPRKASGRTLEENLLRESMPLSRSSTRPTDTSRRYAFVLKSEQLGRNVHSVLCSLRAERRTALLSVNKLFRREDGSTLRGLAAGRSCLFRLGKTRTFR